MSRSERNREGRREQPVGFLDARVEDSKLSEEKKKERNPSSSRRVEEVNTTWYGLCVLPAGSGVLLTVTAMTCSADLGPNIRHIRKHIAPNKDSNKVN